VEDDLEPAPGAPWARPAASSRRRRAGRDRDGAGCGRAPGPRTRSLPRTPGPWILAGAPASIDPAKHGDLGSASFVSQLYESLTAVDPSLTVRPALAESWTIEDEGRRVTFTLREGLAFSDGSPLTAGDVVHSWRRLFQPGDPSPLASLIADVVGARDLLVGRSSDVASLGVRADDDRRVVVDMERGGGDLPAIVSGAPFAVVPSSAGEDEIIPTPGTLVGSGGYVLDRVEDDRFVLTANPHYWAGEPAIGTVRMLTTIGGASPVDAFVAGEVDVTPIGFLDAGWIAYDRDLGPALRSDPSLSVTYYGFDARQPPFDDVRVRRAFAQAVDWRRLAELDEPGSSVAATGMVPAGMPGGPEGDYLPPYDPAGARRLLADAGYATGDALGPISFIASGGGGRRSSRCCATTSAPRSTTQRWTSRPTRPAWPLTRRACGACRGSPTTRANDFRACCGTGSPPTRAAGRRRVRRRHRGRDRGPDRRGDRRLCARHGHRSRRRPAVPVSYGTSLSLVREGARGQPGRAGHPAPRGPRLGGQPVTGAVRARIGPVAARSW
jgi:ABC-type transport system substrate-binding protein